MYKTLKALICALTKLVNLLTYNSHKCYNTRFLSSKNICYNKNKIRCYDFVKTTEGAGLMTNGKYKYETICEYIVLLSMQREKQITNLRLQKVLYYVQGYFLKLFEYPAFNEDIQAWQYGPVVPEAYYDYCIFGNRPLKTNTDWQDICIETKEKKIINKVFERCCDISIGQLVEQTHNEDPWKNTKKLKETIPLELINDYFASNDPLSIKRG